MPPPKASSEKKRARPSHFKPPRPSNASSAILATGGKPDPRPAPTTTTTTSTTAAATAATAATAAITSGPSTSADRSPSIPGELLTRLLHDSFEHESTRLTKDADTLVARYMEIFVKEAIARAVLERSAGRGGDAVDQFLEVEDLEKLAPQLLLDF
ncbi:MAG: hypothetical protein M1826_007751 [Phylliscum demangeonii]|nr:MAG: hypothetical protein M1826_007751 [Phylliscum demangeonii]